VQCAQRSEWHARASMGMAAGCVTDRRLGGGIPEATSVPAHSRRKGQRSKPSSASRYRLEPGGELGLTINLRVRFHWLPTHLAAHAVPTHR
jgi:hypothetical protein